MSNFRRYSILFLLSILIGISVVGIAVAQDEEHDLSAIACKDIMRSSGSDRDSVLALMHGYVLGKKGTTKFNPTKLADASDAFMEHCLDNPRDRALDAFRKIAK